MPKSDIHPEWYPDAKVYCNGEVVMTIGSTLPELRVDVWSGNHPFYTGTQRIIDTEGQVERFMRKLDARRSHLETQAAKEEEASEVSDEVSIAELDLGKRAVASLEAAGITTVGQAVAKIEANEDELLDLAGFGRKSLIDLKKGLRALGFELPATTAGGATAEE